MKTVLSAFIILFSCSGALFAQNESSMESMEGTQYTYNKYYNTIGSEASMLTGYGIMYKRRLSENLHFKITVLPYFHETESTSDVLVTIGGQLQIDVVQYQYMRGYLLFGGAYHYDKTYYTYINQPPYDNHDIGFSVGTGFGAETRLYKQLSIHGEISYGFYRTDRNFSNYLSSSTNGYERTLSFGVGLGIGFMF